MDLFDNVNPEEFLFFISNSSMTLEASGKHLDGVKIKYLCMLICGETLNQIEILSTEGGIAKPEKLIYDILGLGTYFSLLNALSKKKCAMHHRPL